MDLPKNITQVGETDRNCKIYVEDYVVSYMRQMNKFAEDKEITVALFGKMSVEQQITYCFVYGACMVQSISREVRHLSQAQNQEIERFRKKYFPEQTFLGYQILNGDMIEGFRIYDQNSCRYVKGYACFFEKNDTMLAYMLEARMEEAQPEKVEQDKYDMVRRRQEERRMQFEEKQTGKRGSRENAKESEGKDENIYKFKAVPFILTAAACLLILTLLGKNDIKNNVSGLSGRLTAWVSNITKSKTEGAQTDGFMKEPVIIVDEKESQEVQAVMGTLVAEDKLADAVREENENAAESTESSKETLDAMQTPVPSQEPSAEAPAPSQEPAASPQLQETPTPSQPQETPTPSQPQETPKQEPQKMESYVIQAGDTLIAISKRIYGNDSVVAQICSLNNISNPDNIQIGQKILLP